ncbi:MAG: hypothetical protein AABX03_04670 [Nanoarchaeota archaeon]
MIIQRIGSVSYPIVVTVLGETQIPRESEIIEDILEINGVRVVDVDRTIHIISRGYHSSMDYNRYGRRLDLKS